MFSFLCKLFYIIVSAGPSNKDLHKAWGSLRVSRSVLKPEKIVLIWPYSSGDHQGFPRDAWGPPCLSGSCYAGNESWYTVTQSLDLNPWTNSSVQKGSFPQNKLIQMKQIFHWPPNSRRNGKRKDQWRSGRWQGVKANMLLTQSDGGQTDCLNHLLPWLKPWKSNI